MSREMLQALNQRPIAYYPLYASLTGSIQSAVLLSQLMYWFSKKDKIYKTNDEIREEIGLTEHQMKQAKQRIKSLDFIVSTREGLPAKTYYEINWELYEAAIKNHLTRWVETPPSGWCETPPSGWCETPPSGWCETPPSLTEITTEIKNKQKKPGGFLSPAQLAPKNDTATRKLRSSPKVCGADAPETIRHVRTLATGITMRPFPLVTLADLDAKVLYVETEYKELKPTDDSSRARGRGHVRKLLQNGYTVKRLLLAIERYEAAMRPEWAGGEWKLVDYVRGSCWTESKYIKNMGNFFGKEAVFKEYLVKGYKADIDEEDWKWFKLLKGAYGSLIHEDPVKMKRGWPDLYNTNRLIQRYGYSPAQLLSPYDRRFEC